MNMSVLKKYSPLYISLLAIAVVLLFLFMSPGEVLGEPLVTVDQPKNLRNEGPAFVAGDSVRTTFTVDNKGGNDVITGLNVLVTQTGDDRDTNFFDGNFPLDLKEGTTTQTSGSVTLTAKVSFSKLKRVDVGTAFGYGYDGPSGGNPGGVITVEVAYFNPANKGEYTVKLEATRQTGDPIFAEATYGVNPILNPSGRHKHTS